MDLSYDNGELPKPAPVLGYPLKSVAAAAAIETLRLAEENLLRLLEEIGDAGLADKHWLQIGRTDIEKGCWCVTRAVIDPPRAIIPDEDDPIVESGWVLERADSPVSTPIYFAGGDGNGDGALWSADHLAALRLARESDGRALAAALGFQVRVAEHQWG